MQTHDIWYAYSELHSRLFQRGNFLQNHFEAIFGPHIKLKLPKRGKTLEQHSLTVTLAKCDFELRDRFWLQTKPLRSFWGPSRLFQRRNFSLDLSSFTQNENSKHWWKGESRRFQPISVRLTKIAGFESQNARFLHWNGFYLHWLNPGGINNSRLPKVWSISSFYGNHQDSETTLWDQKSISFPVTDRPNPKLAI